MPRRTSRVRVSSPAPFQNIVFHFPAPEIRRAIENLVEAGAQVFLINQGREGATFPAWLRVDGPAHKRAGAPIWRGTDRRDGLLPWPSEGGNFAPSSPTTVEKRLLKINLTSRAQSQKNRWRSTPAGTTDARKEPARLACKELYPCALPCSIHPGGCYAVFVCRSDPNADTRPARTAS